MFPSCVSGDTRGGFLPRHDEDLREPLVRRQGSQVSTPIPGILQARTLEWVAMSFSNA